MKRINLTNVFKLLALLVLLVSISGTGVCHRSPSGTPKNGFVPDEATAINIAEAIWLPIYGKSIYNEKPFHAKLYKGTVWVVEGTLPVNMLGGTAYIEINKSDCRILKVTHGK